jgi:hypothetical protein
VGHAEGHALTAWDDEALGGEEDEFVAQRPTKLVRRAERRSRRVVDFWVAFLEVVIIVVRRLIREGWGR